MLLKNKHVSSFTHKKSHWTHRLRQEFMDFRNYIRRKDHWDPLCLPLILRHMGFRDLSQTFWIVLRILKNATWKMQLNLKRSWITSFYHLTTCLFHFTSSRCSQTYRLTWLLTSLTPNMIWLKMLPAFHLKSSWIYWNSAQLIIILFQLYRGTTYKQITVVPMGYPLSPILANFVLEVNHMFDQVLQKLRNQPFFIKKYVDDII